jgi:hypothetical protein
MSKTILQFAVGGVNSSRRRAAARNIDEPVAMTQKTRSTPW